ncbi:hypothetical protein V6U78_00215 [Marinospirillum sp. MEB164]|uniref:Uncharacterized protein n=1 Tax=Marinospirillum alkalitolerans TaxID=3123374 RepID=A0ABW8PT40_9GAMM
MGLAEKKASHEFQKNRFDGLKEQLNAAAGFDLEVEVNWTSLEVDNYAHLYDEAWAQVFFNPLINAFKEMCADDFAQGIIKEGVKKVIIQNTSDNWSSSRFAEFKEGVLTLDHSPITNIHHEADRQANIKEVVEKGL